MALLVADKKLDGFGFAVLKC